MNRHGVCRDVAQSYNWVMYHFFYVVRNTQALRQSEKAIFAPASFLTF